MGRGKSRRRKKNGRPVAGGRKRSQRQGEHQPYREPDVIGDLQDQAAWSSYTQDIPRLGNEYRENLRFKRIYRFYSGVVKPSGKVFGREPRPITRAIGLLFGVALVVWFLYSTVRLFLQ